ncbi:hypothetical protein BS78_09G261400 [Paspalum vaginatum]|nr:hypothetical protein BS78_09G261400 [Paspalum vaginatum]
MGARCFSSSPWPSVRNAPIRPNRQNPSGGPAAQRPCDGRATGEAASGSSSAAAGCAGRGGAAAVSSGQAGWPPGHGRRQRAAAGAEVQPRRLLWPGTPRALSSVGQNPELRPPARRLTSLLGVCKRVRRGRGAARARPGGAQVRTGGPAPSSTSRCAATPRSSRR